MGIRLLNRWVHQPLRDRTVLTGRQQHIAALREGWQFEAVRTVLDQVGDVERILGRVALGSARPRDLTRLCTSLAALPELHARLPGPATSPSPPLRVGAFPGEMYSLPQTGERGGGEGGGREWATRRAPVTKK